MTDTTPIDEAHIRQVVKKIVKERGSGWIPDAVEETVYANAVLTLMQLADEALGNLHINFMGHRLNMDIERSQLEPVKEECDSDSEDGMKLRSGRVLKRRPFWKRG